MHEAAFVSLLSTQFAVGDTLALQMRDFRATIKISFSALLVPHCAVKGNN